MATDKRLSPRGHPLLPWKEGESAVLGAVEFGNQEDAEEFIEWKLRQGLGVRYYHNLRPVIVEFEP